MSARPHFTTVPTFELLHGFGPAALGASQQDWTLRCARRLMELNPRANAAVVAELADDLWIDLSGMNPEIAAEMEYESEPIEH